MKYSIIVPVYGVEKYLDQCVKSVLAQSFSDFELILVDDKSPDNCPAMCDSWAQKDSRIRVIHHEVNQGMAVGRNNGMQISSGEYILFLDSDDWMAPDTLEQWEANMQNDPDILAAGANCAYEDEAGEPTWTETLTVEPFTADRPEQVAEAFVRLSNGRVFPFVWNKAFRREFLESFGAAFEQEWISEDLIFNLEAFARAKRIAVLDKALYYYRRTARETMVTKYRPEFFALCKRKYRMEEKLLVQCGADTQEYRHAIMTSYVKHVISALIRNQGKRAGLSRKAKLQMAKEMLADPVTREVMAAYRPQGLKMKVIALLLRRRMARICLVVGAVGEFAQTRLTGFFKKHMIR